MSDTADGRTTSHNDPEATADETLRLDGNAAAGLLSEIFALEMTTAETRCGECGASTPLGSLMMYGGQMGTILRCPICDHVQMRITHIPTNDGHYWLDMSGMISVRIQSSFPV
jgi:hypothetical protein